ncbi:MAG: phospho-sugar mutase [Candidatus Cyclobacteriaceae bacterium M2_1C_046]
MSEVREKAQSWIDSNIDDDSRKTIQILLADADDSALTEAFYKDLEFGTGGLRGVMGVGSNYINRYTIGMATQGLSNYLKKQFEGEDIKVAIAHDSRNNSRYFAETTAAVFSANGITVFLFDDLRPTPELSFAIRHLKCHSGVVLTASHNPKEYNGYKAYWNDGAQLVEPHDKNVIEEVRKIKSVDEVKFDKNDSLIHAIGDDIDEIYLERVSRLSLSPETVKRQKDFPIVFSSIHGTGIQLVPAALRRFGFENVDIVEEQATPDGNFPTVIYPNPEEAEAMTMALNRAKELDAELVMATDPDADRVGIAVKDMKGEWVLLNGNQTASLLIYYLLKQRKDKGELEKDQYIVKTIVTTDLLEDIAHHFSIPCYETLTGFKYIADLIRSKEGKEQYIAGGEESYGYLIGDFVRDKDAVSACALIAEMGAYARDNGKSIYELLLFIYKEFGYYQEKLIALTRQGKKGAEEIKQMIDDFRKNPPKEIAGEKVVKVRDYKSLEETDVATGKTNKLTFPSSNVLQYYTAEGSKISVRPSGTEPKIKFYISVKSDNGQSYQEVQHQLNTKIEKIEKFLMK